MTTQPIIAQKVEGMSPQFLTDVLPMCIAIEDYMRKRVRQEHQRCVAFVRGYYKESNTCAEIADALAGDNSIPGTSDEWTDERLREAAEAHIKAHEKKIGEFAEEDERAEVAQWLVAFARVILGKDAT